MNNRHISFELSYRCNHDCYYCYNKYKNNINNKIMNFNKLKKIINNILKSKIDEKTNKIFVFTGGEPFIHNKFLIKSLKYLYFHSLKKNKDISININTNGTIINCDIFKYIKITKTNLFISLISNKEHEYNKITNSNNYYLFINNLYKFINNNINICGNIVISKYNIKNFEEIVEFYFCLGLKNIYSCFLFGEIEGIFDRELYKKYIDICLKLKEKYKDNFRFSLTVSPCNLYSILKNNIFFNNCSYMSNMISINPNFEASGCCRNLLNINYKFENLNYEDIILKLSKSKKMLNPYLNECKNCKIRFLCYGLCGHDDQLLKYDVYLDIINLIKNENDFKKNCVYYKENNKYPFFIEYIHSNIYFMWDLINNIRKVMNII